MISVKIDTDSQHPCGNSRLTTFVLTDPRFIHSEFMTHAFARNAASTRAIPMPQQIARVEELGPTTVEFWGKNQSGMQAYEMLSPDNIIKAKQVWERSLKQDIQNAKELMDIGVHKQLAGRHLELHGHITVVATVEERNLRNFFALRANKAAQPEFMVLAYRMLDAWLKSTPTVLDYGEWHLPLITEKDRRQYPGDLLEISVARCCWVSYNKHGKDEFELEDALKRHDESIAQGHMSVTQHQAKAVGAIGDMVACGQFGPYWMQYRKTLPNECKTPSDRELEDILANRPNWVKL